MKTVSAPPPALQPTNNLLDKRGVMFSARSLFSSKRKADEEWHQQIDFTAGIHHPADTQFPWTFIRKHTDAYLKKKGKQSQQEIDVCLGLLIESHDAKDVAIAAAAHVMSAASVRAMLNIELSITPSTYYGLDMFLQCLIAAHKCHPTVVTDIEAKWATGLLPFAIHGAGAAARVLQGVCRMLQSCAIPHMNVLPDFSILTRKAIKDVESELKGFNLKHEWVRAYAELGWLRGLAKSSPAETPPGNLLPGYLLDANLAIWRIWVAWRPNVERIKILDGLDSTRRGVLPDMLALEGPDFVSGKEATLREGLVSQYGSEKPLVQFGSLIFEVPSRKKEDLRRILENLATNIEAALEGNQEAFELFVNLTISHPITDESLRVLQAVNKIPDVDTYELYKVIGEIWPRKKGVGGRHVKDLSNLIRALDRNEDLRKVLLQPWLVQGIEKCLRDCQKVVRQQIDDGNKWTHLVMELYTFASLIRESKYCMTSSDDVLQRQLETLPAKEMMKDALEIYQLTSGTLGPQPARHPGDLASAIVEFVIDGLIDPVRLGHATTELLVAILSVWHLTRGSENKNFERRTLALVISKVCEENDNLRCTCLVQIPELPVQFVQELSVIMEDEHACGEERIIKFTKLLANTTEVEVVQVWKGLLYEIIEHHSTTIMRWSLNHYRADKWFSFLMELSTLFADIIEKPKASPPTILQRHLHIWLQELSAYLPYLVRFEEAWGPAATAAVHCILCGGDGMWTVPFLRILESLRTAQEQPVEKLMQALITHLARNGNNVSEVAEAVRSLLGTTEEGAEACHRIMMSHLDKTVPAAVTEISVAGWLQDEDMEYGDKTALLAISFMLGIERQDHPTDEKIREAAEWYEAQEAKLLAEAARLDSTRRALKGRDPEGTALLLEQLGIADSSPLDDDLESLPIDIVDAFEKLSDNEVEITFPLTAFTELQLKAMGATGSKSLVIRVYLEPPAFCIHFEDDSIDLHTPWVCLEDPLNSQEPPQWRYCEGRESALAWSCSRIALRHLKLLQEVGLAGFHELMTKQLTQWASNCIVCGQTHGATETNLTLRRAVPCTLPACSTIWNNVSLEIRIAEIKSDPFVLDMLLYGVYAAAVSGRPELLPGCPIQPQRILNILASLPALSKLTSSPDRTLKIYHKDAPELLTWACSHYRGFLSTASGLCRIPSMPAGTHQFVLANASPELERNFARQLPRNKPTTKIFFHGTSLDRLPAILAQGLKIQSGTSLQRTGAAHGKGIYLAEDPSTSFAYAPSSLSWKSSGLHNMRLLLGCEVVGGGNNVSTSQGIHLIRNEHQVMVRYVFLLMNDARAPFVQHVVPAMGSACAALRSGAV